MDGWSDGWMDGWNDWRSTYIYPLLHSVFLFLSPGTSSSLSFGLALEVVTGMPYDEGEESVCTLG